MKGWETLKESTKSRARLGKLTLSHGEVETPTFMPVGTYGIIKGLPAHHLKHLNPSLILVNAFHLYFYPGEEILSQHGGIHHFMGWSGPILSDSGGYQAYSLRGKVMQGEKALEILHPRDGSHQVLTPEAITQFQQRIGVDIAMCLDICPPHESSKETHAQAVRITYQWAKRCKAVWQSSDQLLFGILQGGVDGELRQAAAEDMVSLQLDGYAIGGLGIGERQEERRAILNQLDCWLPRQAPRYLMGVGYQEDIIQAVKAGIDLFDCVLPTRNGRNGQLFTSQGVLNLKANKNLNATTPPDPSCSCPTCRHYSLGYLAYLFRMKDMGAAILATLHNLYFYLDFMEKIRHAIASNQI